MAMLRILPIVSRWLCVIIATILLCYLGIFRPHKGASSITSDGLGYHIWTHALLSGDFTFCRYERVAPFAFSAKNPTTGICQNMYPPGVAILRLPAMTFFTDPANTESISAAENMVSAITGMLALVLTVAISMLTLKGYGVQPGRIVFVTLATVFGTGLFHYATFDNSYSHIYSALGVSIFLYLLSRLSTLKLSAWSFIGIILASLLFFLFRNTNVFMLGIFCVIALSIGRFSTSSIKLVFAVSLGTGIGILAQLAYNSYAAGHFQISSYGSLGTFIWNRPMFSSVLFSYERGLFTYYPIILISLIAGFLKKETRILTAVYLSALLFYAALYGYWHSWFLGGGFGHRGFVELAPVAILCLGLAVIKMSPLVYRVLSLTCLACVFFTTQLMFMYWDGSLPIEGADSSIYWGTIRSTDNAILVYPYVRLLLFGFMILRALEIAASLIYYLCRKVSGFRAIERKSSPAGQRSRSH